MLHIKPQVKEIVIVILRLLMIYVSNQIEHCVPEQCHCWSLLIYAD